MFLGTKITITLFAKEQRKYTVYTVQLRTKYITQL